MRHTNLPCFEYSQYSTDLTFERAMHFGRRVDLAYVVRNMRRAAGKKEPKIRLEAGSEAAGVPYNPDLPPTLTSTRRDP